MSAVAVETPASVIAPHKKQAPFNSIPSIDSLEGIGSEDSDEYSTLKKLQRHLEWVILIPLVKEIAEALLGTSIYKRSISKMSRGLPAEAESS